MPPNRDRRATLGWAAACLLLAALIGIEWQAFAVVPPVAGPDEPPAAAPTPERTKDRIPPLGPLQAYAAVIERPLFTQSRRPPSSPGGATQPDVRGALSVAGILVSGPDRIALIRQGAERKLTRVREGQTVGDWVIRSIATDRVILDGHDGEATLLLPGKQASDQARR